MSKAPARAQIPLVLRVPKDVSPSVNGLFGQLGPTTYLFPSGTARVLVAP
jgi:hypothetical protein